MKKSKERDTKPVIHCAFDKLVPTKELKNHPRNINRHSQSQVALLANLIEHHGWRNPITVSNLSGYIVRGHGRLAAAKRIGLKEVPVDYQDYPNEVEEVADLIADNKVHDYSEVDVTEMKSIMMEFEEENIDLGNFGFIDAEIGMLMDNICREMKDGLLNMGEQEPQVNQGSPRGDKKKRAPKREQNFICPKCGYVALKP